MNRLILFVLPLLIACSGSTTTPSTSAAPAAGGDGICDAPADSSETVQEAGAFKVSQLEWANWRRP